MRSASYGPVRPLAGELWCASDCLKLRLPMRQEKLGERTFSHRRAYDKSLVVIAAFFDGELQLLNGLNAFDRGRHVETGGHHYNRSDNSHALGVCRRLLYKRSIDLDLVELEATQIIQRGVTRAEIIHRQ